MIQVELVGSSFKEGEVRYDKGESNGGCMKELRVGGDYTLSSSTTTVLIF